MGRLSNLRTLQVGGRLELETLPAVAVGKLLITAGRLPLSCYLLPFGQVHGKTKALAAGFFISMSCLRGYVVAVLPELSRSLPNVCSTDVVGSAGDFNAQADSLEEPER